MSKIQAMLVFAAGLLIFVAPDVGRAADCQLTRVASLDMTFTPEGRILVPVTINGTPEKMMIDTGAPATTLDPNVANDLGVIEQRIYQGFVFNSRGHQFQQMTVIHSLGLDQSHASELRALISPDPLSHKKSFAGLLGADLLRHYDLEFDFAAHKFNLFSQDHCEGKVIYWPADAVAVVPLHIIATAQIELPVQLDGKDLLAMFDTGADDTYLDAKVAANVFNLKPGTADLKLVNTTTDGHGIYLHTFATLGFDGIAIGHPDVYLFEELGQQAAESSNLLGSRLGDVSPEFGDVPLLLGMKEMQHFHIFLSYKEQKLYLTPATPPAPPPAAH